MTFDADSAMAAVLAEPEPAVVANQLVNINDAETVDGDESDGSDGSDGSGGSDVRSIT